MNKEHNDEKEKDNSDITEPILTNLDDLAKVTLSTPQKNKNPRQVMNKDNNNLYQNMVDSTDGPIQLELFHVEKQIEVNGVEMGVLENGVPYLSERGLSRMCGLHQSVINDISRDWQNEKYRPRGKKILELLERAGYNGIDTLFLKSEHNGSEINAYTGPVCMAILEYYAFEAKPQKEQALNAFRTLANVGFNVFIYSAVGYAPEQRILDSWKHFHDRVDLTTNAVPFGFFCVFREISSMIVPMIRSGVIISDKVVPDISAGKAWSSYWESKNLESEFGTRIRFDHNYPDYYPQSKSNPQPAWAYPDAALGIFRRWLAKHYIINKFPKYLLNQERQGKLAADVVKKAIDVFIPKQLEGE